MPALPTWGGHPAETSKPSPMKGKGPERRNRSGHRITRKGNQIVNLETHDTPGDLSACKTAKLTLSRGLVALIDAADLPLVGEYKWSALRGTRTFYATRSLRLANGARASQRLHQLILGITGIDHIDGNGLDNRRTNLRLASKEENGANQRKTRGTSAFKGVSWNKRNSRWEAKVQVSGRLRHLGSYRDEIEAALAYDAAAREMFGEFAALNFPLPGERGALERVTA